MKSFFISSIVASVALSGCVKVLPTDSSPDVETVQLRATITSDNRCTVDFQGRTYTSTGMVRGATLPAFAGATNLGYHEIECWVKSVDGPDDGSLAISFSGNSYQKPFPTGTFAPRFEAPSGSSEKFATVIFLGSSYPAQMFRTLDSSTGSVVVEAAPTGALTIRVDVSAQKLLL